MKFKEKLVFASSFLLAFSLQALADEVIFDDLIVTGSECVGEQCQPEEVFDFDTLKLKSDNPQIRFEDTSSTSSFPTNDWTMGVLDSPPEDTVFFVDDANADAPVLQMSSGANGGVALGANSTLEENAISVGSEGGERRITYVADGTEVTDAVNVGQFDQFKVDASADVVALLESQISDVVDRIEDLIARLDDLGL